jgi:cytidine deaminase
MRSLDAFALQSAVRGYAPYTGVYAGIALQLRNKHIVRGSYLENVGFNPSLPPLQAALIMLIAEGYSYHDIVSAVLVETVPSNRTGQLPSYYLQSKSLLSTIAPTVSLIRLYADEVPR